MDEREESVFDACYMEGKNAIGDYAPIHAALMFIANEIEEAGLSPKGKKGKEVFLNVATEMLGRDSPMEINPWLPCYVCGVEVLPIVNAQFLKSFIKAYDDSTELCEFYRCPDCGGGIQIAERRMNDNREYYLPWEHPDFRDDFGRLPERPSL